MHAAEVSGYGSENKDGNDILDIINGIIHMAVPFGYFFSFFRPRESGRHSPLTKARPFSLSHSVPFYPEQTGGSIVCYEWRKNRYQCSLFTDRMNGRTGITGSCKNLSIFAPQPNLQTSDLQETEKIFTPNDQWRDFRYQRFGDI